MSKLLNISIAVLLLTTPAWAHWLPEDGHKMHFPQLPDPNGWDVKATTIPNPAYPNLGTEPMYLQHKILADDWLCTSTGYIDDIHFWGSWRDDLEAPIIDIHLSIHSNDPAGEGGTDPSNIYSEPDIELWSWDVTDFTVTDSFDGVQGWYDPNTQEYIPEDHDLYYQYNIVNIPNPYWQERNTIYWLDITVKVAAIAGTVQPEWGWKTSQDHWNDAAVYSDDGLNWFPMYDPAGETLDLAFVITPEPATLLVLALGLIPALLRLRRRKRA